MKGGCLMITRRPPVAFRRLRRQEPTQPSVRSPASSKATWRDSCALFPRNASGVAAATVRLDTSVPSSFATSGSLISRRVSPRARSALCPVLAARRKLEFEIKLTAGWRSRSKSLPRPAKPVQLALGRVSLLILCTVIGCETMQLLAKDCKIPRLR